MNTSTNKQCKEFSGLFKKQLEIKRIDHLTYKELARFFNVSHMSIYNWLSGKSYPSITRVEDLANKLNVPMNYLIPQQKGDSNVSKEDRDILQKYHSLSIVGKVIIDNVMKTLLDNRI